MYRMQRSSTKSGFSNQSDVYEESMNALNMSSSEEESWISWYCRQRGNEFFCEVDKAYIREICKLTGLEEQLPMFREALRVLLDSEPVGEPKMAIRGAATVWQTATKLYGLIHSMYILTDKGLVQMITKWRNQDFGRCRRVECAQAVLPIGLLDVAGEAKVKLFCPRCCDLHMPHHIRYISIDGSYFGTEYLNKFFSAHKEIYPHEQKNAFTPRKVDYSLRPLTCPPHSYQSTAMGNIRSCLRK